MEWTVVVVLIALAGFFGTVGAPVLKLNKTITTLNVTLTNLKERVDKHDAAIEKQQAKAKESHLKLWQHNTAQDEKIAEHEWRIKKLEEDNV